MQTLPKVTTRSSLVPRHLPPPMVPAAPGVPGDTRDGSTQHGPRAPSCSGHCCKTTGRRMGIWVCPPPFSSASMAQAEQQWPRWSPRPQSRGSGNGPSTSRQPPTTAGKVWEKKEGKIISRNNSSLPSPAGSQPAAAEERNTGLEARVPSIPACTCLHRGAEVCLCGCMSEWPSHPPHHHPGLPVGPEFVGAAPPGRGIAVSASVCPSRGSHWHCSAAINQ